MITLANVRDFIKQFGIGENFYIGKLDNKKEKSIGIYPLKRSGPPVMAIGGLENSSYDIKSISMLIHWNKNADETEKASIDLFCQLQNNKFNEIGNTELYYIKINVPEPIDVGTDDNGVYERVIEFDIYYKRSET